MYPKGTVGSNPTLSAYITTQQNLSLMDFSISFLNVLLFLGLGALSGLFAGMFGIGGGIIIVPSLSIIFSYLGFDLADAIRIAMATSMANMIFVSISSFYSNYKLNYVVKNAFLLAMPFVLFGTITGLIFANSIDGRTLSTIFGIIMAAIALRMILESTIIRNQSRKNLRENINKPLFASVFFLIGNLGGLTGLGGGFASVPFLSYYCMPIKEATGTSSGLTLTISLVGTLFYLINNNHSIDSPFFIGHIFWIGVLMMLPTSIIFANLGANLKKHMQDKSLVIVFSILLTIVSFKMMFPNLFDALWK